MKWYTDTYSNMQPALASTAATENAISGQQVGLMGQAAGQASADNAMYNQNIAPAVASMAKEATNYGSEANQNLLAGEAGANVTQQFANAQKATNDDLARKGVNPDSGMSRAMNQQAQYSQAAATAGAENQSRQATRQAAFGMQGAVGTLGNGILQAGSQALNTADAAGSAASASASLPISQQISAAGLMGQGFGVANQANSAAGSMAGTIASIQQQANNSSNSLLGSLGGALGTAAGNGGLASMGSWLSSLGQSAGPIMATAAEAAA